jgi:hypothetical protein
LSGEVEARLEELVIEQPLAGRPGANRVPAVRTGNLVFLSGHGPIATDDRITAGKLGRELTAEDGYAAARLTGLAETEHHWACHRPGRTGERLPIGRSDCRIDYQGVRRPMDSLRSRLRSLPSTTSTRLGPP